MMAGNSFKSDIAPAVAIGCKAIHIPYHIIWRYEQTDTFEHHDIITISRFEEMKTILLPPPSPHFHPTHDPSL